jgi:hypothetical protein
LFGLSAAGYDERSNAVEMWSDVSVWVLIVIEWLLFIGGVAVAEILLRRKLRS